MPAELPHARSFSPVQLARRWAAEARLVRDAAQRVNASHLRIATLVMLALDLVHVVVFGVLNTTTDPVNATWAAQVTQAHAVMACLMAWCFWMLTYRPHGPLARHLPVITAAGVLCMASMLTLADQRITTNISAYLNASAAVAIVLLLRPLHALVLYALAGAGLAWGLGQVPASDATLLSNRVNVATASVLSLMVSVLLWRRFVQTELLQQALTQSNRLLEQQRAELETLATRDALTGLLNRRECMHRVHLELARARRDGTPVSLLIIDLDHFKDVNDRFGHPAGDAVLRHIASLMAQSVRSTDLLARWGGEEFVVLLPNTDAPRALILADKLRLKLAATPTLWQQDGHNVAIPLSASIGLSSLHPDNTEAVAATMDTLLSHADQALYAAKRAGRNRVVRADSD